MRCFWCHNPEGRRASTELRYNPDRCIACGACVSACPNNAHELKDGVHLFHRGLCDVSGACVDTCYSGALELNGRVMTVEQVLDEVLRDKPFYDTSHGGVTLSGGEPTLNSAFTQSVLEQCKRQGIHTAIETCADCSWDSLHSILAVTDLVMMDLKIMDVESHQDSTGRTNNRILANARLLASTTDKPIIFRTPVVPTVNDSEYEIGAIASFIRELVDLRMQNGRARNGDAGIAYELLAFHRLASDKYSSLGLEYEASRIEPPTRERMTELTNTAKRYGVDVHFR